MGRQTGIQTERQTDREMGRDRSAWNRFGWSTGKQVDGSTNETLFSLKPIRPQSCRGVGGREREREGERTNTAFNRVRAAVKLYIYVYFVVDRTDVGIKSFHTSFHPSLSLSLSVWHVQYRQQRTIRISPNG